MRILTVNAGSSSVKSALYALDDKAETLAFTARVTGIGEAEGSFVATAGDGRDLCSHYGTFAGHDAAIRTYLDWLQESGQAGTIDAIGHRLVHGGLHFTIPERITPETERKLETLVPLDPDHLPAELAAIRAIGRAFPETVQVACFDTAFHRQLPAVARMLPLPRALHDDGIVRFGFHGLSYEYICGALAQEAPNAARGRVVIAHLGAGASLAAVRDGRPIDTTMGFTPTGGLMMGTRSGDLDPGIVIHLMRSGDYSPDRIDRLLNRESGLLGVSGTSADMGVLVRRATEDSRAAEAVALFCYTARKYVAAMAASLGGLDTLVFTAGIGEHAPTVRQAICDGLDFLGVTLDPIRNLQNLPVISAGDSVATVRVMKTNEEIVIARATGAIARPLADPTDEDRV